MEEKYSDLDLELRKISNFRILAKILFTAASLFFCGYFLLMNESIWIRILLWFIMGLFLNILIQMSHDSWHSHLFTQPWMNRLYGFCISLISGVMFEPARHCHILHHRFNRTDRDPDAFNAGKKTPKLYFQYYTVFLLGAVLAPLHFNIIYPALFYPEKKIKKHFFSASLYAVFFTAVFYYIYINHLTEYAFLLWFMPILFAAPINGLKSIADHIDNDWEGSRFRTATDIHSNFIGRFFYHGLTYHLTHHLFWKIPGPNLRKMHMAIQTDLQKENSIIYESYIAVFIKAFFLGPQIVRRNGDFLKTGNRND